MTVRNLKTIGLRCRKQRWVAFNSDESGRFEVYVASFSEFTSKQQLSAHGGVQPQWRADGRELFCPAPDGTVMSVGVEPGGEFVARAPATLFRASADPTANRPQYAVTARRPALPCS